MVNDLILDFPILKQDGGDFLDDVTYTVEAHQVDGKLKIIHRLKGKSFIRQLFKNSSAKFAVSLLYRDSAERQSYLCDMDNDNHDEEEIVATQTILIKFSYAPEITPSIVVLKTEDIVVDNTSGLINFWKEGEQFNIPKYSRIALGTKLKFTSGETSKLIKITCKKEYESGSMKTIVNENAREGEKPVELLCAQDVFDELHKITQAEPTNANDAMRVAIITQALCAVYSHMYRICRNNEEHEASGVLLAHLEELERKTEENWTDEDFNPSLAATKMQPYAIKTLNDEME